MCLPDGFSLLIIYLFVMLPIAWFNAPTVSHLKFAKENKLARKNFKQKNKAYLIEGVAISADTISMVKIPSSAVNIIETQYI